MKINEILIESKEQLEEGPILNKIGSAVGKGVGTLAKGVGAVAGGIAGVGSAVKKGYQAAKGVVGGAGDEVPVGPGTAAPAAGAAPAGGGGTAAPAAAPAASGAPPSAQDINAQGPAGTAPAKAQTGAAGAALAKTTAAIDQQTTDKAGQTVYAQVKANIDKLDKKGKQRILQLLQKAVTAPAAKPAAAAAPAAGAAPTAAAREPSTSAISTAAGDANPFGFNEKTGKPFTDQTERDAYYAGSNKADPRIARAAAAAAPAAAPAPTNAAFAANPSEVPGKRARGASRVPKKVALSQAELDAEREAKMGPTSDSINRTGNRLAEAFAKKVNQHKQRIVAEEIATDNFSFFKK